MRLRTRRSAANPSPVPVLPIPFIIAHGSLRTPYEKRLATISYSIDALRLQGFVIYRILSSQYNSIPQRLSTLTSLVRSSRIPVETPTAVLESALPRIHPFHRALYDSLERVKALHGSNRHRVCSLRSGSTEHDVALHS